MLSGTVVALASIACGLIDCRDVAVILIGTPGEVYWVKQWKVCNCVIVWVCVGRGQRFSCYLLENMFCRFQNGVGQYVKKFPNGWWPSDN